MPDFEKQLDPHFKELREQKNASPDSAWLKSSRKDIKQILKDSRTPALKPRGFFGVLFARPITVIATVLLVVLLAGGGTTLAAQNTDPDDTLYPMKLAGEQISLMVATSPQAKAKLYIKYADRRMGEFERMYEKRPGQNHWHETVAEDLTTHKEAVNTQLVKMHGSDDYADVALLFEELTRRHNKRMQELEDKLNTTTIIIINKSQERNTLHHQRALESLQRAQERMLEMQLRHEQLEQRIRQRFELLEQLQKIETSQQFNNETIQLLSPKQDTLEAKDEDVKYHESDLDEDGVSIHEEIIIEGTDDENVEITKDINDGQVTSNTRIKAHADGGTVRIHTTRTMSASSNQQITINGEEKIPNY